MRLRQAVLSGQVSALCVAQLVLALPVAPVVPLPHAAVQPLPPAMSHLGDMGEVWGRYGGGLGACHIRLR